MFQEQRFWRLMTKHGVGVKLLATFQNGVIMPFLKGKMLYAMEQYICMDPHIQRYETCQKHVNLKKHKKITTLQYNINSSVSRQNVKHT